MILVQDKRSVRFAGGIVEEVMVPSGFERVMTVNLEEVIHLSKLTPTARNKIKKGLVLGIMDARGGVGATVYKVLCDHYGIPQSSISAGHLAVGSPSLAPLETIMAKDLILRTLRGSNTQQYYYKDQAANYGRPTIYQEGAMHYLTGYNCGIKRDEAAVFIKEQYRNDFGDKVELAVAQIEAGETLVYKTTIGV